MVEVKLAQELANRGHSCLLLIPERFVGKVNKYLSQHRHPNHAVDVISYELFDVESLMGNFDLPTSEVGAIFFDSFVNATTGQLLKLEEAKLGKGSFDIVFCDLIDPGFVLPLKLNAPRIDISTGATHHILTKFGYKSNLISSSYVPYPSSSLPPGPYGIIDKLSNSFIMVFLEMLGPLYFNAKYIEVFNQFNISDYAAGYFERGMLRGLVLCIVASDYGILPSTPTLPFEKFVGPYFETPRLPPDDITKFLHYDNRISETKIIVICSGSAMIFGAKTSSTLFMSLLHSLTTQKSSNFSVSSPQAFSEYLRDEGNSRSLVSSLFEYKIIWKMLDSEYNEFVAQLSTDGSTVAAALAR
jgi:hypothetical protein